MLEQIAQRLLGGGDVGKLLGPALGQLAAAVCGIRDELSQVRQGLEDVKASLGYEFGKKAEGVAPYDPRALPHVWQVATAAEPQPVSLRAALGKPATRGHVLNLGDKPAVLWFATEKLTPNPIRRGPYTLPAGAALEISWAAELVEVHQHADGATSVQIFAQ